MVWALGAAGYGGGLGALLRKISLRSHFTPRVPSCVKSVISAQSIWQSTLRLDNHRKMEDLTFAYLDGGNVVMLSRPGTAAGPPCSAKDVFRWLFCGISADPSDAEDGDHAKSQNRPKDLWYQSDYLTEPNQHKEEAPLLVGPAKL